MGEENLAHLAAPPTAIYQAAGFDLVLPIPLENMPLTLHLVSTFGHPKTLMTLPHLEAVTGLQACLCSADLSQIPHGPKNDDRERHHQVLDACAWGSPHSPARAEPG